MLTIKIEATEFFDENTNEFIQIDETELVLEHSLVTLATWESTYNKQFLNKQEKTPEEELSYIKCMTLNDVDPMVYMALSEENVKDIKEYIEAPMSAIPVSAMQHNKGRAQEPIYAELIYYWMISLNIPVEFENWHLNRLLSLIRVCSIKNEPPKKMGRNALIARNRELNAARRQALKSKG